MNFWFQIGLIKFIKPIEIILMFLFTWHLLWLFSFCLKINHLIYFYSSFCFSCTLYRLFLRLFFLWFLTSFRFKVLIGARLYCSNRNIIRKWKLSVQSSSQILEIARTLILVVKSMIENMSDNGKESQLILPIKSNPNHKIVKWIPSLFLKSLSKSWESETKNWLRFSINFCLLKPIIWWNIWTNLICIKSIRCRKSSL